MKRTLTSFKPLKTPRLTAAVAALSALALLALSACGGGIKEDPILRLAAEESLAQGKQLLAQEKYAKARPYFTHAFEVEPNSATGREALLLAADTFYLEGGSTNFVQAEAKYRDYLNRFPTSEQAAYVQFQIANSLARRMERPDRDQTTTRKALEAYEDLVRLYPTSEYAAQAQEQREVVRANLAEHEYVVGRFYLRYGAPRAAVQRFEFLLANFPQYPEKDKVLYHLGLAHQNAQSPEEAAKAFERLRTEYPDSGYAKDVPRDALQQQVTQTSDPKVG
jgi:outer membrane protein assembly factor BamD